MAILWNDGATYTYETDGPLVVPGLGPAALTLRAQFWIEGYDGEDPVYHVLSVSRRDTGAEIMAESFGDDDEAYDDWADLRNLLTELFCVALTAPDDAVTKLGELA